MKYVIWDSLMLGGFIGWFVGSASFVVGKIPDCSNEPYSWWLPVIVAAISIIPALYGYRIGKNLK